MWDTDASVRCISVEIYCGDPHDLFHVFYSRERISNERVKDIVETQDLLLGFSDHASEKQNFLDYFRFLQ